MTERCPVPSNLCREGKRCVRTPCSDTKVREVSLLTLNQRGVTGRYAGHDRYVNGFNSGKYLSITPRPRFISAIYPPLYLPTNLEYILPTTLGVLGGVVSENFLNFENRENNHLPVL